MEVEVQGGGEVELLLGIFLWRRRQHGLGLVLRVQGSEILFDLFGIQLLYPCQLFGKFAVGIKLGRELPSLTPRPVAGESWSGAQVLVSFNLKGVGSLCVRALLHGFARHVLKPVHCPTRVGRSAATGACEQSLVSFISLAIRVISRFAQNLRCARNPGLGHTMSR